MNRLLPLAIAAILLGGIGVFIYQAMNPPEVAGHSMTPPDTSGIAEPAPDYGGAGRRRRHLASHTGKGLDSMPVVAFRCLLAEQNYVVACCPAGGRRAEREV